MNVGQIFGLSRQFDGVLTVRDEDGKPTGKPHRLAAGDNPAAIAGVLMREAWLKEQGDGTLIGR